MKDITICKHFTNEAAFIAYAKNAAKFYCRKYGIDWDMETIRHYDGSIDTIVYIKRYNSDPFDCTNERGTLVCLH